MNSEKIMDAIEGISNKYIEKYAVPEPIKYDRLNCIVIQRKWVYRLCACFAVVAIIIGIGIPLLKNHSKPSQNEDVSLQNDTVIILPFTIAAYAISETGIATEQKLSNSNQMPISILETSEGLKGILISVDSTNLEVSPSLVIVTSGKNKQKDCDLCDISGVEFEQGKRYFFFVGQNIHDFKNVTFRYSDKKTEGEFEITAKITEKDSGYFAELERIVSYPIAQEP